MTVIWVPLTVMITLGMGVVPVQVWLMSGCLPLVAVMVKLYRPPVGVPVRVPLAGSKVMPGGSVPVRVSVGVGLPVAATASL